MAVLNPLRLDPSRTTHIVRSMVSDLYRRLNQIIAAVNELVVKDDAFGFNENKPNISGIISNAGRWKFKTNDAKAAEFRAWLKAQVEAKVLSVDTNTGKPWTNEYIHSAYRQGVVRAFTDARPKTSSKSEAFYAGGKSEFLRDAFAQPEATAKLKLLATRSFEELKGITDQMSKDMNRILADGIAHGKNPKQIARDLTEEVDISKARALRIARTEIIHAHSEGQLDSFEKLKIDELGVDVEWTTAGDGRVCPRCQSMAGTVWKLKDARGVIPLHPNCRCAWVPANVGEATAKTIPGRRVQKESAQAAPELYGHQPTAVIRWMGKEGMSFQDAKRIFAETGTQVSDATIRAQLLAGRQGTRGAPAALKAEEQAALKAKLLGPVQTPPPVLPPVPAAPPVTAPTPVSQPTAVSKTLEEAVNHLAENHAAYVISEFGEVETIKLIDSVQKDMEHFQKFDKLKSFLGSTKGQVTIELNQKVVADGGPAMGLYHSLASNIQINGKLKPHLVAPKFGGFTVGEGLEFSQTFRHEYGHHVWFKGLTASERQEFIETTKQFVKTQLGRESVSIYGASSEAELWAEAFGGYTNPKYVRGTLPKVIEEFMDAKLVGKTATQVAKTGATEAVTGKKVETTVAKKYLGRVEGVKYDFAGLSQTGDELSGRAGEKQAKATIAKVLGKDFEPEHLGSLVGAQPGATVNVLGIQGGDEIVINVDHPLYSASRTITKDSITNETFFIKPGAQGKGLGTKVFHEQVQAAAEAGFESIDTMAARIDTTDPNNPGRANGYYTWARLGYDTSLKTVEKVKTSIPLQEFIDKTGATRVSDLMKTEEGRALWKEHGGSTAMSFKLDPESISRKVLDGYVKAKGIK